MKSIGIIQNNQSTTMLLNILKADPKQYPPLNKKEEAELIKKYRNDRDKLNELLYMHNIRLAFNMAKRYATKTPDFDALVSDCLYGLAVACTRFDIDKGIKFSTYATNWIFKYCLTSFYDKSNEIDKVSISLSSPPITSKMKSNNGNEVTFENYVNECIDPSVTTYKTISQELSSLEKQEICSKLIDSMNDDTELSATDKAVFIDAFYNKEKAKDIAKKYNITTQSIAQIKQKILSKFKNILKMEYSVVSYSDIDE